MLEGHADGKREMSSQGEIGPPYAEAVQRIDRDLTVLEMPGDSKETLMRHLRSQSREVAYFMGMPVGRDLGWYYGGDMW